MNMLELRSMIDGMKIASEPKAQADCFDVKLKANRVVNMISRTLSAEYKNACCAEDWHDYYFKVCEYVNKQYRALMALSNDRWIRYIEIVELNAEFSAKSFIEENHEYLEADKANRISHLTAINNMFRDFVFTFLTLLYTSQNALMKSLNEEYNIDLDI